MVPNGDTKIISLSNDLLTKHEAPFPFDKIPLGRI
jgi:hypothetical protein